MQGVYESMTRQGLSSGTIEDLGEFAGALQIFLQGLIISVTIIVACAQHLDIKWLPDIAVAIPVAALGAIIARMAFRGVSFGPAMTAVFGTVVSRIMNDLLIPISIFEGAYHCQRLNFYSQFLTGLTFAVFGTLLSAIWIAIMVKKTGDWNLHEITSWRESFAYAAFIADTDPVATLSIFSKLKVDALLSAIVAGEATLNDPIALVVFNVCNVKEKEIELEMGDEGVKTLVLLGGSITLGLLMGLLLSKGVMVCKVRGKGPLETAYIFQSAYVSFCFGEYVNMSGIIVTLFAGLMMGIYAEPLVEDADSVNNFLFNAARIADNLMFLIIGLTFFLVDNMKGIWLGLMTIVFCFISRALTTCILVPIVNLFKYSQGLETISFAKSLMIFHSGLRGGMTVMMALMLNPYWMGADNKETMVIATIVTVTGMCYLCGCTGPFFLNLLQIPMDVPQDDGTLYSRRTLLQSANKTVEMIMFGREGAPQRTTSGNTIQTQTSTGSRESGQLVRH